MKWLLRLFVLGFVLLLVGVLVAAFLPAKLAVDWLGDRLGSVKLEDVGGTVWNGYAGAVSFRGQALGRLNWQIHPAALLHRRLDADVGLDGGPYTMKGAVSLLSATQIDLRDVSGAFPAERMNPALDIPGLIPVGTVEFRLAEATLVGGFPRSLRGDLLWRNAAVAGEAAASFGDLAAEFHTNAAGAVEGLVEDRGGPLAVEGTFKIDVRGYEAEALLEARDGNPDVIKALQWIGEPLDDGSSLLKIEGRIIPL